MRRWLPKQSKRQLFSKVWNWLLERGTVVTIVVVGIQYTAGIPARIKQDNLQKIQTHYQSWQIISSSKGQEVNGARIEALQLLSEDGVYMGGINIEGASLLRINLKNAHLENANFNGANLYGANFQGAILVGAFFSSGDPKNPKRANLNEVDLRKADLSGADFTGAYLQSANFQEAQLDAVTFKGADLDGAILKNAKLCGTEFKDEYLCADFRGAENLTVAQIQLAKDWEKADYDPEMRSQLGLPPKASPATF